MSSELLRLQDVILSANTGLDAIQRAPIVEIDTGVKCLRIQDISQSKPFDSWGFTEVSPENFKKFQLKKDDILIARTGGSIGVNQIVDRDYMSVFNNGLIRLRVDCEKHNPLYVYYLLQSEDFKSHIYAIGYSTAAQPNMKINDLLGFQFQALTKAEEDQISNILKSLDDRIALLRETNTTLEAIAQALFKSWFVDFDPVHANAGMQAPSLPAEIQALFPSRLVESPQGLIPEGWEWRTLNDVSEVGIGKTPPRKEKHWFSESPGDMRWVSIRDMGLSGAYLASTNEYLTREAIARFNVRVVPSNTVMLSFKMTIGRVAISDGEMTTNEAIAHFKLKEDSVISTEFLYLHLKSFNYSTLSSTSSIADAVNSKTVKSIPIVLPSKNVQIEFQRIIAPVLEKIKVIEQQIMTLSNLRDTLLPRLISGQLRLPEAEAALAELG